MQTMLTRRGRQVASSFSALLAATTLTAGCSTGAGDGPLQSTQRPTSAAETTNPPALVSRARSYTTLDELRRDSALIVTGRPGGSLRLNPHYGDKDLPFAIRDVSVDQVIAGSVSGDSVEVSIEAGYENGELTSWKLPADGEYLLFLTPQGDRSPTTYTIVGYLAGIYRHDEGDAYVKVDTESPDLPEIVTLGDLRGRG